MGVFSVGETIPSSLTGDLPVTKSYHAGFAFGISYRFTSSKDPKTNSSTQQNKNKSNHQEIRQLGHRQTRKELSNPTVEEERMSERRIFLKSASLLPLAKGRCETQG